MTAFDEPVKSLSKTNQRHIIVCVIVRRLSSLAPGKYINQLNQLSASKVLFLSHWLVIAAKYTLYVDFNQQKPELAGMSKRGFYYQIIPVYTVTCETIFALIVGKTYKNLCIKIKLQTHCRQCTSWLSRLVSSINTMQTQPHICGNSVSNSLISK